MQLKQYLANELIAIEESGLYRTLKGTNPEPLNFSTNSYLGRKFGAGSSRLVAGNSSTYTELENLLALWKKAEASLVYPTGYMTNLGVISALMSKGDAIIIDKLCHASIIDGCYLSDADVRVFKHNDLASLEKILGEIQNKYQKKIIITESVFSMDGDIAPLFEISMLAKKYDCWTMVDEAHAVGVFGETGAGLLEEFDLENEFDIRIGTLSKAVDSLGGYVAGSRELIDFLINKSRSFIYTTALPETVVKQSLMNLKKLIADKKGRKKLWENIGYFYLLAKKYNLKIEKPNSAIIPIIVGDEAKTLELSKKLLVENITLPAIRYPTVPKGAARLRCTITAKHTKPQIEKLVFVLCQNIK
jgi:8-amino-7-oxononanoate synthase